MLGRYFLKLKHEQAFMKIFKTPSGPPTGKALLNHAIFSPSQPGETVPLNSTELLLHILFTHILSLSLFLSFPGLADGIIIRKFATERPDTYLSI